MAAKDEGYVLTVSTVEGDTKLEVRGNLALIHQMLQTLWGSQNGTPPAPRADPPSAHMAKPARPQHKRPGRAPRADEKHYHDKVKPVAISPPLERKCRFCANPFRSPHSGQLYCSLTCKVKAHQVQRERPSAPVADTVL
jgi:hypothetical protein